MKTLRNINPLGYVDLPLIGREGPAFDADGEPTEAGTGCLIPGEEFDVSDEVATRLLEQEANYELVVKGDQLDGLTIPALKKYAAQQNPPIDLGGATTKAAILAAIRKG